MPLGVPCARTGDVGRECSPGRTRSERRCLRAGRCRERCRPSLLWGLRSGPRCRRAAVLDECRQGRSSGSVGRTGSSRIGGIRVRVRGIVGRNLPRSPLQSGCRLGAAPAGLSASVTWIIMGQPLGGRRSMTTWGTPCASAKATSAWRNCSPAWGCCSSFAHRPS